MLSTLQPTPVIVPSYCRVTIVLTENLLLEVRAKTFDSDEKR